MLAIRGPWHGGAWVLLSAWPGPDECSACQDREPCTPHEQSAAERLRAWTPALKDPDAVAFPPKLSG